MSAFARSAAAVAAVCLVAQPLLVPEARAGEPVKASETEAPATAPVEGTEADAEDADAPVVPPPPTLELNTPELEWDAQGPTRKGANRLVNGGIVLTVSGSVGVFASIFFLMPCLDTDTQLDDKCFDSLATPTYITAGISAALLAGGVTMLVLGTQRQKKVAAAPFADGRAAGVALSGKF